MPTYLTRENSRIYSPNSDILDLDPNNTLDLSGHKHPVDGLTHTLPLRPSRSTNLHDSFDESSTSSTHASDISDSIPTQMNGTRPTSMSSLPNGSAGAGGGPDFDYHDLDHDGDSHHNHNHNGYANHKHPFHNGAAVTMPDRTAPPPPISVVKEPASDTDHSSPTDNYLTPPTIGSPAGAPIDYTNKTNGASSPNYVPPPIPSQSNAANGHATPATAVSTASPSPVPTAHKQPPSPQPLYNSAAATPSASTPTNLQPPPPNVGLKHRHTLEVPGTQSNRASKDGGSDAAFASGRFSPTSTTQRVRRASLNLVRRDTRSMQSDVPRDEVLPDEDALRWAEHYRQKRASKRKRKEEEDDDRVLVGTKVDEHHANWVTAYNMLTGIRVSVSRTNAKLDRPLTDADFEAKQKSTFDIAGNELVPSAKYDFKFKDYAPWVFRHLRNLFRLDPADYLMSLTGKYILSELGSPGKSGSFFYFSRDYKYIIKTIHHAEHKFLRKILKDYYHHVTENPNTLLSQFYGLHRVKMPYGKKIHFVVMNNLFPPHRDIHTTFDLKGSTIGRDYKEDDLDKNPRATLKDLNWMRRQRHLELGIQKKQLFLEQLQKDVVLMKKLKIMDYSLLIGIHDLQRGNEENLRGKTLQVFNPGGNNTQEEGEPPSVLLRTPSKLENARKARELRNMIRHERPVPMGESATQMPDELDEGHTRSGYIFNQDDGGFQATHEDNSPAEEIYYLGVIDCLTHYGMIKKIEHFWKGLTSDKNKISALPPDQYGDRFYNFVEGITMSPEEAIREKQRKDQEQIEAAAAAENQRVASWSSSMRRRSTANNIPPMPNYQPPPTPPNGAPMSPEARETVERAQQDARRSERYGASEANVPEMVLSTAKMTERRESGGQGTPILPVVEEAAEASSLGGRSKSGGSRNSDDYRPATPAKTGMDARFAGLRDYAPPTPPKGHHLKPESQDSGYGALPNGNGSAVGREDSIKPRLSRDSLDKALPPLPNEAGRKSKMRAGLA
ncbi:phosphatidylinositol-4-phosphate 5-Kinase [Colletotrichum graminicola]|uniref:1-phosphatidylinositol-4-phosphate 5-kinase n=1 Tax=Colletotrichum graminicola (strain M1.001 / M2 / FGSC 10212) TaxID=645133 RepID=E3QTJ0_COLGM|nr:phosphatidylinositol-4-phosphate 5-Kinase [Colletotrichum graminicola M1.001]EFQ34178.1 phosphatidylinositol-4-phosphate 5-Kinase [Colletotrichum graminicola M1.001]WDK18495.1 phosphatidylinositol-4-phosphate 5-Kinase [Colletotrichum graminicola]